MLVHMKKMTKHFITQYEVLSDAQRMVADGRVSTILASIENAPKSVKWKLRAKVGTRKKWYQDVREVWD